MARLVLLASTRNTPPRTLGKAQTKVHDCGPNMELSAPNNVENSTCSVHLIHTTQANPQVLNH
jgi:hypothetical protein